MVQFGLSPLGDIPRSWSCSTTRVLLLSESECLELKKASELILRGPSIVRLDLSGATPIYTGQGGPGIAQKATSWVFSKWPRAS